ncbi:hypothetical protein HHI36_018947 [Cryptolaemus montrouzieri]|uniref:Secreted protein n=1 Tax=Cryptolaemus montrouzieri TaxID=559131 RepID=A0ABD2P1K7_9CUCU
MLASSATTQIMIQQFTLIVFITASMFRAALKCPGQASKSTSFQHSVKDLYHTYKFFFVQCRRDKCHAQHFKCVGELNFSHISDRFLYSFFPIAEIANHTKVSNLYICPKQTKSIKWLKVSTLC